MTSSRPRVFKGVEWMQEQPSGSCALLGATTYSCNRSSDVLSLCCQTLLSDLPVFSVNFHSNPETGYFYYNSLYSSEEPWFPRG